MTARKAWGEAGHVGRGGGFTTGFWRPDKSSGKIAVPEGPHGELPLGPETTPDGRLRDPRTAENLAAKEAALAPRRYTGSAS